MTDDLRFLETCRSCGAVGYGNATCSVCVRQWPRFGISDVSVEQLLAAIGDKLPMPPFGTRFH